MASRDVCVVLVHGAWGSPAMWQYVTEALDVTSARIEVADLPSANRPDGTLADDIDHVRALADAEEVVLCGHSYGGAVITEAGVGVPGLAHLVYLAAFAPDVGESTFDLLMRRPIEGAPLEFRDDGTTMPTGWGEDDGRYDADTLDRMRTLALRPHSTVSVTTPLSAAAWRETPATYVVAASDTVIHPETQTEMADRADARVVTIESDHMINLARPNEVAAVLTSVLDR